MRYTIEEIAKNLDLYKIVSLRRDFILEFYEEGKSCDDELIKFVKNMIKEDSWNSLEGDNDTDKLWNLRDAIYYSGKEAKQLEHKCEELDRLNKEFRENYKDFKNIESEEYSIGYDKEKNSFVLYTPVFNDEYVCFDYEKIKCNYCLACGRKLR